MFHLCAKIKLLSELHVYTWVREREKNNDEEKAKKNIQFDLIMKPLTYALLRRRRRRHKKVETHFVISLQISLLSRGKKWTAGYHRGNKEHLCILIYCVCYSMRASPAHALNRMLIDHFQYSFISAWLKFYTRVKFVSLSAFFSGDS